MDSESARAPAAGTSPPGKLAIEPLSEEECWRLLTASPVGRIAFLDAHDKPMVLPVNHTVVDRQIVFRTALGAKLGTAAMQQPVAFEVDEWSEITRSGWSVVATGTADFVLEPYLIDAYAGLGLAPWVGVPERTKWVRIPVAAVTGRRVHGDVWAMGAG